MILAAALLSLCLPASAAVPVNAQIVAEATARRPGRPCAVVCGKPGCTCQYELTLRKILLDLTGAETLPDTKVRVVVPWGFDMPKSSFTVVLEPARYGDSWRLSLAGDLDTGTAAARCAAGGGVLRYSRQDTKTGPPTCGAPR